MTEVIQSSSPPSHFPSPSRSSSSSSTSPCVLHTHTHTHHHQLLLSPTTTTPTSISSSNHHHHHHQQQQKQPLDLEQETQEQEGEFFGDQDLDDQDSGGTFLIERRKTRGVGGDQNQFSVLALLLAAFRRSIVGCSITTATSSAFGVGVGVCVGCGGCSNNLNNNKGICNMEIGLPTNVRHVAHVTFDRFNGFLGLPVEFEPEVPRRAPSARLVGLFMIF